MRRARRAANLRKLNAASQAIEVQVDELVLHGFARSDRYAIGEALSTEVQRLLVESSNQPFLQQTADHPRLDAGQVPLAAHARPATVGAQIGQAVHASLNQSDGEKS